MKISKRQVPGLLVIACALVLNCALALVNPYDRGMISVFLGSAILWLGLLPLVFWIMQRPIVRLPGAELHFFFYSLCFGVGVFIDMARQGALPYLSDEQVRAGAFVVLLGLLSIMGSYYAFLPKLRRRFNAIPFREVNSLPPHVLIAATTCFVILEQMAAGQGTLSQLLTPAWKICWFASIFFVSTKPSGDFVRVFFWFVLTPYIILAFSGVGNIQLAGLFVLSVSLFVAYALVKNKIPYVAVTSVALLLMLMQPVKEELRSRLWYGGEQANLATVLGAFASGARQHAEIATEQAGLISSLAMGYQRVNHFYVTASIVADTPAVQPFQLGASYLPLVTKLVPRFLWENKPLENYGNVWARRYGYINFSDENTSFNLPWMPEMYMNFGVTGVLIVNLLLGFLMAVIAVKLWVAESPFGSGVGLWALTMVMFPESNLSMGLGGLMFGALVAWALSYGLPLLHRIGAPR